MGLKNIFKKKEGEAVPTEEEKAVDEEKLPEHETGRAQWSSPTEFLLTCIGYSVGLGNVWRFPYLCYKNGGGAFLIPYIIMMALIGMPLLFMEYAFGQYFGVGGLTIFKKVSPVFQGIGIGYMVLNGLVCVYYNVIIAMSLYYLFASFTSELPWKCCGHEWNTPQCVHDVKSCGNLTSSVGNSSEGGGLISTLAPYFSQSSPSGGDFNLTQFNLTQSTLEETSPSDEYFRYGVLQEYAEHNVENLGAIRWHLCLCLLLAWILVIMFVSRGIKSTGKVAYFTATFPYLMLTVLVIRGVTLEGAAEGIKYFIQPNFTLLTNAEVWYSAASQLFYSTNLAWGGMITMASYNTFHHNCFRDAIMINIVSFCTSLYAGIAVFSIIGYMAHTNNVEISDVIKSGPGLAFVVYPQALSMMPLAPMFSALFFFMLFLLGVGSQMVLMETVVTGIVDEYPQLGINPRTRFMVTISVAVLFLLFGIPHTTQGGMYVLQLMDHYSASFSVLIIAVVECIAINWVYRGGYSIISPNSRFASNVKEMLDLYPRLWWRICWKYISPIVIFGILAFSFAKYESAKYGEGYIYPAWAECIGWFMVLSAVLPIPIIGCYRVFNAEGADLRTKWRNASKDQLVSTKSPSIEMNGSSTFEPLSAREEKERLALKLSNVELDQVDEEKALNHNDIPKV